MTPSVHEGRAAVPAYSQLTAPSCPPSRPVPAQAVESSPLGGRDHGRLGPPIGRWVPLVLTLLIVATLAAMLWWTA
jgi:hypothetical protein